MKKILFFTLILFIQYFVSEAQSYDNIDFNDKIYVEGVNSVKVNVLGFNLGYPIIKLNGSDRLKLEFDDLLEESRYLKYTLIHCTHDWKPSDLNQLEYLDGFMEDEITDYSYSFNTIVHYIHYELEFPNDILRITKSGNYILFVYDDTPDNPILTRRIMVEESTNVGIQGNVHAASDVSFRYTKQEIDFTVFTGNYIVRDPANNLKVNIVQNGRWDNAIVGLRYRSGKIGEYSFDYDNNENVMNGGSEFRLFSVKSLRYNADRIVSIKYLNRLNHAYVIEDVARPFGAYETNTTLKGRCYYGNEDFAGENSEDYVLVHFSLKCDFPIPDGKIYVFGELTDWKILEEAQLTYNPESNYWETALNLKQGYYNYQYVYVQNGTNIIDDTFIEGSHWETQNEYAVFVYIQEEGTNYDKLVGTIFLSITE